MSSPESAGGAGAGSAARLLKWVGAATAVISLILGIRQVVTITSEHARRAREASESIALAGREADRREFAEAWKSLDQAQQLANSAAADAARLDIAMRWLEDARPGPNQPFSRITDAVVPTLDRAMLDPQHPRRADVLAHLGWATFLKGRDTGTAADPAVQYREALAIDPTNVYANAMLAHWMLWQHQPVDAATPFFDAALATGREHALVRTLQLAALRNVQDEGADRELMRVANSMRQQNEMLDPRTVDAVYDAYVARYGPNASDSNHDALRVGAADLLTTYEWLVRQPGISNRPEITEFVRAMLQAAAGHPATAISTLRAIVPKVAGRSDTALRSTVMRQIARLEHVPPS